jgi:hypothetical protein
MAATDDTLAGSLNDETAIVSRDAETRLGWLAWSEDEPGPAPLRQSWGMTWGHAAVIASCGAALAVAIGFAGWAMMSRPSDGPVVSHGTWAAAPAALPPVTTVPAAVTPNCAPGHNADWGCIPVPVSTPAAVPPPTVTVAPTTVTVAPAPSQADRDEQFLAGLTGAGLRITDVREAIGSAHSICAYLAAGHSEADAARTAQRNNASLGPADAVVLISTAVRVYCPEQAD